VTPTVFRQGSFRFYFFWIEPQIELVQNHGLSEQQLSQLRASVESHIDIIRSAWKQHFFGR
jgi:hypothetical protein